LRLEITQHALGQPHVERDQPLQRLVHPPALVELDDRDADAFLEDLRRIAGVRAGHAAADVRVMADHHAEALQRLFVEDREEHEDVG
jgi:hypothetical protein